MEGEVLADRRAGVEKPMLSVIIPCKNESRFLPECLASIHAHIPSGATYEIIVVDNESTDDSIELARKGRADVILSCKGRIGACRNAGAAAARADLYLFLDADVALTPAWTERARVRLEEWHEGIPEHIWGSWLATRPDGTWVEHAWFEPLRHGKKSHMNSGHLIVRAATFRQLQGFDASLETGEDYEFCMRAAELGVSTENDSLLVAIHLGYPREIKGFFLREMWHGRGDVATWRALLGSRVALISMIAVHGSAIGALGLLLARGLPQLMMVMTAMLPGAALALVARTFGGEGTRQPLQKLILAHVYIIARGVTVYRRSARIFRSEST